MAKAKPQTQELCAVTRLFRHPDKNAAAGVANYKNAVEPRRGATWQGWACLDCKGAHITPVANALRYGKRTAARVERTAVARKQKVAG